MFSKVRKALDTTLADLDTTKLTLKRLQSSISKSTTSKRRRILPDPNSDFVSIDGVLEERVLMAGCQTRSLVRTARNRVILARVEISEDVEVVEDCIVAAG